MISERETGLFLYRFRKSRRVTQTELASMLGVSNKTVSAWELGNRSIPLDSMQRLLKLFDISLRDFYLSGRGLCERSIYICKKCGNTVISSDGAEIYCCGTKLCMSKAKKASDIVVSYQISDNRLRVCIEHEMIPRHYILFVAYLTDNGAELLRFCPHDKPNAVFTYRGDGDIVVCCSMHGVHRILLGHAEGKD